MSSPQHENYEAEPCFILASLGDTEDLERYEVGGFHPVHLGDVYDGHYRVVHKLSAGGFSTVWLTRDDREHSWVALKIIAAGTSKCVLAKRELSRYTASQYTSDTVFLVIVKHRYFTLDGLNGRHLYLVIPILGPSMSRLSDGILSRIRPWLSRRTSY